MWGQEAEKKWLMAELGLQGSKISKIDK